MRELSLSPNGALTTPVNWRDQALCEALRGFNNAENLDALLAAVRQFQPEWASVVLWAETRRALQFLERRTARHEPLLAGSVSQTDDDGVVPYMAWYAVEWEGEHLEVALCPSYRNVVCMGASEAAVHRFGQELRNFANRPEGRCLLYSAGWSDAPELAEEMSKVAWEDIVLAPDVISRIREAIEGFFRSRDAFTALGFAWRRGILLVGPPGTGKTMVCKAAAAALPELPLLYVRDLRHDHDNEAIQTIFARARELAPCILTFEDIDGLIGDGNRTVFLNELDGFRNNEGMLIIASSNHPGQIDEALLKRPSRFDRVFHIGLPALAERRTYCEQLLARSTLSERLAPSLNTAALTEQVAEATEGFTPAYIKEAFIGAALQRAQAGAMLLNEEFAAAVVAQVEELRLLMRRLRDPDALAEISVRDGAMGFRR